MICITHCWCCVYSIMRPSIKTHLPNVIIKTFITFKYSLKLINYETRRFFNKSCGKGYKNLTNILQTLGFEEDQIGTGNFIYMVNNTLFRSI